MEEVVHAKTNLAPALPIESLEQGLLELGFSERGVRSLFEHTEFPTIPFRSHQLSFLRDYARDVTNHPVSARDLARLFKINERTVYLTLQRGLQQPGPLGRHNALDEESEQALVGMLLEAFHAGAPMDKKQLLHIVQECYRKTATWGWVNAFIVRIWTLCTLVDQSLRKTRDSQFPGANSKNTLIYYKFTWPGSAPSLFSISTNSVPPTGRIGQSGK
jgi:hypothetical protein